MFHLTCTFNKIVAGLFVNVVEDWLWLEELVTPVVTRGVLEDVVSSSDVDLVSVVVEENRDHVERRAGLNVIGFQLFCVEAGPGVVEEGPAVKDSAWAYKEQPFEQLRP